MYTDNFLHIANIKKTIGNKGELIITATEDNVLTNLQDNQWLFIDMDGDIVPFLIEYIQLRNPDTAVVKLNNISIETVNKYTGFSIYLKSQKLGTKNQNLLTNNLSFKTSNLSGFRVIDKDKGEIGLVKRIIKKPLQDLVEVEHDNHQILIPADKSIITKVDTKNKTIHINAPEGLIDLYL